MKLRRMDSDSEPISNCMICDTTSTSFECEYMFEISSEHNDTKHHICSECLNDMNEEMLRISREISRKNRISI